MKIKWPFRKKKLDTIKKQLNKANSEAAKSRKKANKAVKDFTKVIETNGFIIAVGEVTGLKHGK